MTTVRTYNIKLIPVMFCFFTMGIVDLVGIASNYVKVELGLNDAQANIFPSLVFFWFLLLSVPTGMLINKIGRKRTVLLSLYVTFISLLIPLLGSDYIVMLISFCLLGIGNTMMQTSLNPLVSGMVSANDLASTLTFGQFVKATASFSAPYIAMWGSLGLIYNYGLGWRVLFPIYLIITLISIILLHSTHIKEEKPDKASGYRRCFELLSKPFILFSFIGIMCHVGIDVGTNTTAPKILMNKLGITLVQAGFASSLYFVFRIIGSLLGSLILKKISSREFFILSTTLMSISLLFLPWLGSKLSIYICIALIGFGNANIFPLIYSKIILTLPDKQNEVSGLMTMALFGGAIFPLFMGFASDMGGQNFAITIMAVGAIYLSLYSIKIK